MSEFRRALEDDHGIALNLRIEGMGIEVTRIESRASVGRRTLVLAGVAALAFALAGCGKRGPLEPPPDSTDAKPKAEQGAQVGVPGGFRGGTRRVTPIRAPKEPFILDPLLD